MSRKRIFIFVLFLGILFLLPANLKARGPEECGQGYEWQPLSGVGCVQSDCNDIPDAHWSYTSQCVCGSSGSDYENLSDPNKECSRPADYKACPSCVYACVHLDEPCPDEKPQVNSNVNTSKNKNVNKNTNSNSNLNQNKNTNANTNTDEGGTNTSLSTSGTLEPTCQDQCNKFLRGHKNATVVEAKGNYPDCQCQIDINNDQGYLTQTISVDGDIETTFTFDPSSGRLISKEKFNRKEELEKIRARLGYRYTEKEIDKLLNSEKMIEWFNNQIKNIKTETSMWRPQFWWQHVVAILDHGFNGNSAEFVDINEYGRCGDSMQWLERNLTEHLNLGDNPDLPGQKHEAMLSITGEKYGNFLNHTSLMIRPSGISNLEWEEIVKELKKLSGGTEDNPGITPGNLQNIDPRLLDAKVLDPYKKELTTVREFIKGWSYIRIS